MAYSIVLDAGHGGRDPGAVYEGRTEKEDNINLAMKVGDILSQNGFDVLYTRTDDTYNTPFEKATIANNAGADFFVSFHRNSNRIPNSSSGVETLVYDKSGIKLEMAQNINDALEDLGFNDRGVIERPNLVVLRRTQMPAVLIETGFINNTSDNQMYDKRLDEIALAIARGIAETVGMEIGGDGTMDEGNGANENEGEDMPMLYKVQVGAFANRDNAVNLVRNLSNDGYKAYIEEKGGLYRVFVGGSSDLVETVELEKQLRRKGYQTYITT